MNPSLRASRSLSRALVLAISLTLASCTLRLDQLFSVPAGPELAEIQLSPPAEILPQDDLAPDTENSQPQSSDLEQSPQETDQAPPTLTPPTQTATPSITNTPDPDLTSTATFTPSVSPTLTPSSTITATWPPGTQPASPTSTSTATKTPTSQIAPTLTRTTTPTSTEVSSPPPPPTSTDTPLPPSCDPSGNGSFESALINLINQERGSRGLAALSPQGQLATAARNHSADMACNGFFSHTGSDGSLPWDRVAALGYGYSAIAENIFAGSSNAQTAFDAWMNSTGHRDNMLNPAYTEIGIGYRYWADSPYGAYTTAVFAHPR